MNTIVVKPKDGLIVVHPESGQPIRGGQTVPRSPQILRFLKDGDLLEVVEQKVKKKTTSKKEAE